MDDENIYNKAKFSIELIINGEYLILIDELL